MIYRRVQILLLALAICTLTLLGCGNTNTPASINTGRLTAWTANTPNPLLQFVPEDAPLIFATQRGAHADNRGVKNLLNVLSAHVLKADLGLQYQLGKSDDSEAQMHRYCESFTTLMPPLPECQNRSYDELDNRTDGSDQASGMLYELLTDYNTHAETFGLDPLGELDAAGYVNDTGFVFHITIKDEFKAMEGLDKLVQEAQHRFRSKNFEFETNDRQGSDKYWKVYRVKNIKTNRSIALAAHAINSVMTIVVYDSKAALPNSILTAQQNYYKPDDFDSNAFFVGHIEYGKLAKTLFSNPSIIEIADRSLIAMDGDYKYTIDQYCREHFEYCDYGDLLYYRKLYNNPSDYDSMFSDDSDDDLEDAIYEYENNCSEPDDNDTAFSLCPDQSEEDEGLAQERLKREKCERMRLEIAQKKAEKQRKWDEYRVQMLEKVDAAIDGDHIVGTERLRKLELTSIGEDVCIQEIDALTQTLPALNWAFAFNSNGDPHIKVTQIIDPDELYKDVQTIQTDYIDLKDSYKQDNFMPWLHFSLGIDMRKAMPLLMSQLDEKAKREWSCDQARLLVEYLKDFRKILKKRHFNTLDVTSFTGVIRELNKNGHGEPKFWINMRASERMINDATKTFFRKTATDTVTTTGSDPEIQMLLVNHQDLLLATKPFDVTQIKLNNRKNDHLLELYARKLSDDMMFGGIIAKWSKVLSLDRAENVLLYIDVEDNGLSLTYQAGDY